MYDEEKLSFAYRYPFSDEARDVVGKSGTPQDSIPFLRLAKARIEEGLASGSIAYKDILYGQRESVLGYAYARLMASALPMHALSAYAVAEARRSCSAMSSDSAANISRLLAELGISSAHSNGDFTMDIVTFLMNSTGQEDYALVNQRVSSGSVRMGRQELAGMAIRTVTERIMKGLPIPRKEIPKLVLDYAKEIRLPKEEARMANSTRSIGWIERLLLNPIPDIRQRVVGLVLAPYLVTVRGLDVEDASKVISGYIEKCKAMDPNTRITDAQIRYQCNYAKSKGMRPLSLKKAEELLSPVIDMDSLEGR